MARDAGAPREWDVQRDVRLLSMGCSLAATRSRDGLLVRPVPSAAVPRLALRSVPAAGGLVGLAVAVSVLAAWALTLEQLRRLLPGELTMQPMSALALVALSVGMIAAVQRSSGVRSIGRWLIGGAVLLAALSGSQYLHGRDLGLDRLLFADVISAHPATGNGRMAPLVVLGFLFVGVSALLASTGRAYRLVVAMTAAALFLSALNGFDYLFTVEGPNFLVAYTQMPLGAALAFSALSVGALGMLPRGGPLGLLAESDHVARMTRLLLAGAVGLPLVIALLRVEGERRGLYDTAYGVSLSLLTTISLLIILIWRGGRSIRLAEQARLRAQYERDRFFEMSLDLLSVIAPDDRFTRVNGAWSRILGYAPDELVGTPFLDLLHPDDRALAEAGRAALRGGGIGVSHFEQRHRHRDGSYRWIEWTAHFDYERGDSFAVGRDITVRKAQEARVSEHAAALAQTNEELSELARRDPLTGLFNRGEFVERGARIVDDRSEGHEVSLILFDLDHFGDVNKRHGHQTGDAALRAFADVLRQRFRASDLVARYGGEEFVVILENIRPVSAQRAADDARRAFAEIGLVAPDGSPLHLTTSAGCASRAPDGDLAQMLAAADAALALAKRAGRNQVVAA
jgi:diguanylate cyclase (GGDEF)-like protein/PAS domain S-box-containing protein